MILELDGFNSSIEGFKKGKACAREGVRLWNFHILEGIEDSIHMSIGHAPHGPRIF